ncbi:MAG: CoA transferase [Actinobacteria bacterium]|nr:CoA transferase [Actinomycetota bacterium]MBI3686684.1 CoA transferase [Actinomycetota bacterium]
MGPLQGLKVVEIASLAPAPFGCMVLADLGAQVLLVRRPGHGALGEVPRNPLHRGRRTLTVDLKNPHGAELVRRLAAGADVLVEGFRPGVAERLGIGPADCLARNPRLVYGRMTGWGQQGPLARRPGHDINYLAVSGALEPIGRPGEPPPPPLNYVADFGGGGMLLAVGVLAALYERNRSGRGQVIDAAMVDGAALHTAMLHGMRAGGLWSDQRGGNLLDGGAPFYDTYACADGRFVAVGALEPQFYAALLDRLGLAEEELPGQHDPAGWPRLRARFAEVFAGRTRDEWAAVFADSDACVAPVLAPGEAADHPHTRARSGFVEVDGVMQPAPAPRFDRTPAGVPPPPHPLTGPGPAADLAADLAEWGLTAEELGSLRAAGAVADPVPP